MIFGKGLINDDRSSKVFFALSLDICFVIHEEICILFAQVPLQHNLSLARDYNGINNFFLHCCKSYTRLLSYYCLCGKNNLTNGFVTHSMYVCSYQCR